MAPPRRNPRQWIRLGTDGEVRPPAAAFFKDDDLSDGEDFLDDEEEDHSDACAEHIEDPVTHRLYSKASTYDQFLQVLRSSETAQAKGSNLADIMVDAYLTTNKLLTHWSAWTKLQYIAELVPRDHPWQDSLLECVTQLMHRPDYRWKKHVVYWDALNDAPSVSVFDKARNFNKFHVGFTLALYELLAEHDITSAANRMMHEVVPQASHGLETPWNDGEPQPYWVLNETNPITHWLYFEDATEEQRLLHWKRDVLNAADWFVEGAYRVLKFMFMRLEPLDGNNHRTMEEEPWADLGPLAMDDLSTEDPPFCVKRWKFWKRRFAAILDEGLIDDDDHVRHIRRALRAMRRAERDMKLAYERTCERDNENSSLEIVEKQELFDTLRAILQSPESPQAKGNKLADTILDLYAAANETGCGHEKLGAVWEVFWRLVLWECRCRQCQDALVECVTQLKGRRDDAWEALCALEHSFSGQKASLHLDFRCKKSDAEFEALVILNCLHVRFHLLDHKLGFRIHPGSIDELKMHPDVRRRAVQVIIHGLESPQPNKEDVWFDRNWELDVLQATDWLVEWAEGVYFMTGPCESIKISELWRKKCVWVAPRLCGENQLDSDTPAFRLHRWTSWKSRLATILDRQLIDDPRSIKRIRLAIRRMTQAEEMGEVARENRLAAEALPGNPYDDDLPSDTDDAATVAGEGEGVASYFEEGMVFYGSEEDALNDMGYHSLTADMTPVVERMRNILQSPRTLEARGKILADYIITQSCLPKFQNLVCNIWGCFLLIAFEVPKHHPWQNGLLECLESLRHRGDCTWWLDSFSDQLWAQHEKMGWKSGHENQQRTNFTSFLARFKRAEYKHGLSIDPDEARENLAPFVWADLIQGLELNISGIKNHHEAHGFRDDDHSIHRRQGERFRDVHHFWEGTVWRAADWLIECADEIYDLITSGYEVIQPMYTSERSPRWWIQHRLRDDELDEKYDSGIVKRWAFWKRRFAAVLESNLMKNPRGIDHIHRAIECMNAAEQRAGGNAEGQGQEQEQEQGLSP